MLLLCRSAVAQSIDQHATPQHELKHRSRPGADHCRTDAIMPSLQIQRTPVVIGRQLLGR
jgi:hypothetical protein